MQLAGPATNREGGFTLVEVMIATVVVTVGLLSVAYSLGLGLTVVQTSTQDTIARQKAREAMEDVFTARDDARITFDQVCNVGGSANCIFVNGFTSLTTPGPDQLVNTADDGGIETVDTPGPDGILGTADDIEVPLTGYQRSIAIIALSGNLKQITVTIQYRSASGLLRNVTLVALMSQYV